MAPSSSSISCRIASSAISASRSTAAESSSRVYSAVSPVSSSASTVKTNSGAALSGVRAAEAGVCGAGVGRVGVHSSQVLFGALLPVLGIGCYFASLVLANGGVWAQRLTMLFSGEGALLFAGGALGLGVVVPAIGLWLARGRVRQAAAGAALFWATLAFLAASMGAGCWHRAVLLLG